MRQRLTGFARTDRDVSEQRVVELDGGRSGPFDRGACQDLLKVKSLSGSPNAESNVPPYRMWPKSYNRNTLIDPAEISISI